MPVGEDCCGGTTLSMPMQKYLNYLSDITEHKGPTQVDCFLAVAEARGENNLSSSSVG